MMSTFPAARQSGEMTWGQDSSSLLAQWLVIAAASLLMKTPDKCHYFVNATLTAYV